MTDPLHDISSHDLGPLGIYHLKRMWAARRLAVRGTPPEITQQEWHLDRLIFDGLGLGLETTMQFLYAEADECAQFEDWVLDVNRGAISPETRQRINQAILSIIDDGAPPPKLETLERHPQPALDESELAFFDEHGYVVLKQAVSPAASRAAEQALWEHLGMRADDAETWYRPREDMHRIMVQLFQHPALEANRRAPRIHRAFAQLWQNEHLFYSTDRVSFNPPERAGYMFPGPDLHWDAEFSVPFLFSLQGLLYLTDTSAEQGAFTCVPGFHRCIDEWLRGLPEGADPQSQDLHALGAKPIPAKAGDLIIWHHALPHGSRPNRAKLPRMVQHINMYPVTMDAYSKPATHRVSARPVS